jgi:hypothetical protein
MGLLSSLEEELSEERIEVLGGKTAEGKRKFES